MLDAENPAENPDATPAEVDQSQSTPGETPSDAPTEPAEDVGGAESGPEEASGGEAVTDAVERAAEEVDGVGTDYARAETQEAPAQPPVGDKAGTVIPETLPDEDGAQADAADRGAEAAATQGADTEAVAPAKKTAAKRGAAKKTTARKATTKKAAAKRTTKKAAAAARGRAPDGQAPAQEAVPAETEGGLPAPEVGPDAAAGPDPATAEAGGDGGATAEAGEDAPAAKKIAKKAAKKTAAKRTSKKAAAEKQSTEAAEDLPLEQPVAPAGEAPKGLEESEAGTDEQEAGQPAASASVTALLFQPPDPTKAVVTRRRRATRPAAPAVSESEGAAAEDREGEGGRKPSKDRAEKGAEPAELEEPSEQESEEHRAEGEEEQGGERRRRRRGGRRRRRAAGGEENGSAEEGNGASEEISEQAAETEDGEEAAPGGSRRRRRRRRSGESGETSGEEAEGTVSRARKPRNAEDEITAVTGSTRLEAKKQRRREGREAGRRRAPIVSEAEFLARRESVDRVMVIRQRKDLTQIAVLEDKVLVEHYVSRESQTSLIGNVYLGRVQNVLPSMEAAFVDIGKGRNAVLYAGEVNWDALGAKNGSPRKIEQVLKSGQTVLVQVTKDPIGHKGARLTSQISLPGRFLVYVPDGTTSGISRKLPDTERNRLKNLLKEIVPDTAGVIVRTAAEGASEEELTRDVERLRARWEDIEKKASSGNAPQLLYGEPDLTLKVVRDLFTEDFNKLVISGDEAWEMVDGYVTHVAPDLADRLEKYDGERDIFAEYRIDEQIEKALDRKVWLPSGGSLVIDRTEAMTVVDVNTGKFTGSGGNLEETVTKNNLEAAEEIVRQLRLRDIGGIIVVDFIDMVLESNRDLVLRRLVECLGRDRTRHQVAEVTSLGLVQMTRKRIGTGLLEAFSESCEHCGGRGLILQHEPVEPKKKADEESRRGRRGGRRGRDEAGGGQSGGFPSPKDIAAMARHEEKESGEEKPDENERGQQRAVGEKQPDRDSAERVPEGPDGEAQRAGAPWSLASEHGAERALDEAPGSSEPRRSGRGRGGRGRGGRGRGGEAAAEEQGPPDEAGSGERGRPEAKAEEQGSPGASSGEQSPLEETPAEPRGAEQGEAGATETLAAHGAAVLPEGRPAPDGAGAPEGADEPGEVGALADHAAPAARTVVTTVRRRSARRPAGPPSAGAALGPSTAPTSTATTSAAATSTVTVGVDEPSDEAADDSVDEPADVDPLATLVDEAEEPPRLDGGDAEGGGSDGSSTPHVPIKKRGRRR